MCSKGVSVWFACKLCHSFFLSADDFAFHKKKSHIAQFRSTKFIVFEEKTSPNASPPKNWISFLSPKEETHFTNLSPTTTTTNVTDSNPSISDENDEKNRNQEFMEIDLESNRDRVSFFSDKSHSSQSKDVNENDGSSNNCFQLNTAFNSNEDDPMRIRVVDVEKNELLQSSVPPMTLNTDQSLTEPKSEKHLPKILKQTFESATKSNSLTLIKRRVQNPRSLRKSNILKTVIQSPRNPYVSLEKLNLVTIQNASSASPHSNSKVQSLENDANQFNSPPELSVHEDTSCPSKMQLEKWLCMCCPLTFCSSDELNAHNQTLHSDSGSTSLEMTKDHQTKLANDLKIDLVVASKNENQSDADADALLNISSSSSSENTDFSPVPEPTAQVNFSYGHLLEFVKTEYVTDGEFPDDVAHDPFEIEYDSQMDETLAEEEMLSAAPAASSSKIGFNCISCKIHFSHLKEIREHYKNFHTTKAGKKRFDCPLPNCGTITISQLYLKRHLKNVHSDTSQERPFNCPTCNVSFKTKSYADTHCNRVQSKPSTMEKRIQNML